jgi:DedD protein
MAGAVSDEELRFRKRARRRLIGAIALTILVVVALPMVLDREPRPVGTDIAVQIPPQNAAPFAPRLAAPAEPAGQVPAAKKEAADARKPAAGPEAGKAVPPGPATPKAVAAEPPVPAAATGAWIVQLGAFSDPARAKARKALLDKLGIVSYVEVVHTGAGPRTRVRAGPFPTREAAEQVRERLLRTQNLDGIVVPKN